MRILVDSDVIFDLFLEGPAFVAEAEALWQAHLQGKLEIFVAALTPINLFYFARKVHDKELARQAVNKLISTVRVCAVGQQVLQTALPMPISDYEDAVQVACALSVQLDAIITRNQADYKNSPLPIYSPTEFLALLDTGKSVN